MLLALGPLRFVGREALCPPIWTLQHPEHGPRLYRRARRLLYHEDEHRAAAERLVGDVGEELDPERALAYFVASWMGRNGLSGTGRVGRCFSVRYRRNGGAGNVRWTSAVQSIPALRRRLQGVTITSRGALDLIAGIPDEEGVAVYCDPPYLEKTKTYRHDFEPDDHARLAEALARFERTRVVVSVLRPPGARRPLPGAPLERRGRARAQNMTVEREGGARMAPEVLIVNGPAYE